MKRGEAGCRLLTSDTEFPNYWGDAFPASALEYVREIKRCAPHRQHREGTGMARWRDLTQTPPYRAALLAFVAGMYWIWWDSFHEIGRFFMQTPLPFDFFLTRYSSISCAIKPVGVVLGCIAVCAVLRYRKELLATKRLPGILFACEVGLHAFYYLSAATGHYLVACFVYALISACIVVSIMIIALQMNAFEKRVIVLIVIGAIGCYGVFNNLVFPYVFRTSPLIVIGAVYLAALVAGYALSLTCSGQTLAFDEPNRESSVRTPRRSSFIFSCTDWLSAYSTYSAVTLPKVRTASTSPCSSHAWSLSPVCLSCFCGRRAAMKSGRKSAQRCSP